MTLLSNCWRRSYIKRIIVKLLSLEHLQHWFITLSLHPQELDELAPGRERHIKWSSPSFSPSSSRWWAQWTPHCVRTTKRANAKGRQLKCPNSNHEKKKITANRNSSSSLVRKSRLMKLGGQIMRSHCLFERRHFRSSDSVSVTAEPETADTVFTGRFGTGEHMPLESSMLPLGTAPSVLQILWRLTVQHTIQWSQMDLNAPAPPHYLTRQGGLRQLLSPHATAFARTGNWFLEFFKFNCFFQTFETFWAFQAVQTENLETCMPEITFKFFFWDELKVTKQTLISKHFLNLIISKDTKFFLHPKKIEGEIIFWVAKSNLQLH